jgi:hypothetical protein
MMRKGFDVHKLPTLEKTQQLGMLGGHRVSSSARVSIKHGMEAVEEDSRKPPAMVEKKPVGQDGEEPGPEMPEVEGPAMEGAQKSEDEPDFVDGHLAGKLKKILANMCPEQREAFWEAADAKNKINPANNLPWAPLAFPMHTDWGGEPETVTVRKMNYIKNGNLLYMNTT